MIQLENVTKKYLNHKAIDQCSTKLKSGKIIGVIGENGSGKTTFLKLLAGLLRPTTGKVLIDSKQVNRQISNKLAYLTDSDYFYPYFTIEELIHFYQNQFADFDKDKAHEIASFMKIDLKRKMKYLSKGNRSRVKLIVTLARKAPYVVLDEPFSGLDPLVRKALINGIIKFADMEQQTLILTTHEIREVETILDEVLLLKRGRILAHQEVEQIREEYGINVIDWMEKVI
ncbi:ABC transporter ATP-binding protein [Virgibacillus ainsalahensis]